jgi:hypothetical protein
MPLDVAGAQFEQLAVFCCLAKIQTEDLFFIDLEAQRLHQEVTLPYTNSFIHRVI